MTSITSSPSEGEIFTSDSEKANQALPSHNDTSVDRHVRIQTTSLRNHRSRSPYRAPRGEKRRREDGYTNGAEDSLTHSQKSRHENDRYISDRGHGRRPHFDADLRHNKRSLYVNEYNNDRHDSQKRQRTGSRSRSRSPFRHSHPEKSSIHGNKRGGTEERARAIKDESRHRDQQSVSGRSKPSSVALASRSNAKIPPNQSLQVESEQRFIHNPEKYVSNVRVQFETEKSNSYNRDVLADTQLEANGPTTRLDEASLIEERRKRREALKAKYRSQETPALVQALHLGADANSSASSAVQTPQAVEESIVEAISNPKGGSFCTESTKLPAAQIAKEGPNSPAEISFEQGEDLANANPGAAAGDEDEPSAADYDPTVDMQEERARHDSRLFNEDASTSADRENKIPEQDRSGPELSRSHAQPSPASEEKEQKEAFDMFADDGDDEDDMFAEAPPEPVAPTSAHDTKTAQSLDVKMMDNWDDAEGYYMTILGELFESRYHVLQNLGRGMFSSVVRATDTKMNKLVAIKIIRNNETMRKAGIKEIEILKDLAANDADDKKHMIRLERSFEHKGHLCMVFENLSLNLREVLKKFGRDVGINLKAIRAYAQQLFLGLSLLRKCQYLHADLKPDNILVNEARNILKICDLGSASSIEENVTAPYLVSRFYRAPEIMLGIPYDYGIDVWSVGCTLFELYTGKILFPGRNNNAMLRSIMECRGKFPHKVLRKGTLTCQYFDDLLNFQAVEEDKLSGRTVTKMMDIRAKPIRGLRERLVPKGRRMDEQERKEVELFADLLDKCLDLRGDKRITPSEALRHPFIARSKN